MSVIWHDLECGFYTEDLQLWRQLAESCGGPVLDVGAGTGRVALDLARQGHSVVALDNESELLDALAVRAGPLPVQTVRADAREFELGRRFALCIAPMQTVQLLGGSEARLRFLQCARRHLNHGGMLAVALASALEAYETDGGHLQVLPDMTEVDGVLYSSQPTAIRARRDRFVLLRRREQIDPSGGRQESENMVELDRVSADEFEGEASAAGFTVRARRTIAETSDYAGSVVVMLGA